jgi:hypothetical protein
MGLTFFSLNSLERAERVVERAVEAGVAAVVLVRAAVPAGVVMVAAAVVVAAAAAAAEVRQRKIPPLHLLHLRTHRQCCLLPRLPNRLLCLQFYLQCGGKVGGGPLQRRQVLSTGVWWTWRPRATTVRETETETEPERQTETERLRDRETETETETKTETKTAETKTETKIVVY